MRRLIEPPGLALGITWQMLVQLSIRFLVCERPTIHWLCLDIAESLAMDQKIERHERERRTVDHQHQRC